MREYFLCITGFNPNFYYFYREMEKNFLKLTNVTSSVPTNSQPSISAKTVIRIQGDPGYLRTTSE